MYGRVKKYFHDRNYGFIYGEDGNTYFIHRSNLKGEYIDPGYYVSFKPFQNDRSDYNAKNIVVIDAIERKRKYGNTCKKHE
ncbi:MAG: cold shock domain-containing protein [Lachnospiraceae bacterium]|nr:cold shock domain-containing protein [Lachnospiraceae bacterium]